MATSVTACFARVAKTLSPEDREQVLAPLRREILAQLDAQRSEGADARALAVGIIDRMLAADAPAAEAAPAQPSRTDAAPAPAPTPGAGPRVIINMLGPDGLTDAERAAGKKPYNDAPAPAPTPASLPTDADLAADQELQDALGKLGDVLGDVFGAKKNITGPQYSAADLLPTLSKVVELLVRKGFRSFKAATARAAQLMRGNPATAPHVDAISPRQWKAAYNAIAEGHGGTDSEEAVGALTADEVRGLVAAPEQAQNAAREPTQPPVDAADSGRGEAPGRGRGASAQQRPAQVDPGDVGAREPGNVASAPAASTGGPAGEGAPGPDVGAQEGSDGGGPAGDRRPRAGGTRDADARAGGRGRKPAAGRGKPAPVDPESVSPANPGPGDFVIDDPLRIVGGGQVARFEKNKAAIELRNRLVEEGRAPTREEQEVLAGYTGWGSFGQELFQGNWERPAPKAGWEERDRWLRDNLGRKEWEGMQTSIINAHYTDPPTVLAMWDMVRRMGFTGGRVLEPSIGIGNFYGMMPADLTSRSQRAGIELDPVTGSMAQMLYPGANIQIKGYEQSTTPDNFYDLVIGNWPFFEQGPADRRYNRLSPTLHDYFFLKAIDQTKPGGLVVGITTHGTMDKKGIGARMEMARKAELVAAFRLPTGAFQEYAGTKVVTDIIILRKRAQPTDLVAKDGWIDVLEHNTAEGTKVWVNEYFHRHPEHVIGRIDFGHGTTTFRPGLIVHRPDNMMAELRRIVDMVPDGAFKADQSGKRISYVANHTSDRTNALVKTDKGLFIVQGEYLAPANEVLKYEVKDPAKTAKRVRELESLIDMRRLYGRLIDAERAGNADKERTALREAYEAFVKRSGTLADSFGLSYLERIDDPFYPSLAALEVDGKPATILSRSTMRGARSIENPSISDAFVLARAEAVNPTLDRIAAIAKKPQAAVKAALIDSGAAYELPNGDFAAADIYLSGNVREKLRAAKAALESGNAAMQRNVDSLTEVQPATIPYYKIETQMGATWVPAVAYEEYIAHMLGMDKPDGISVKFEAGSWKVEMDGALNHRPQASSGAGVQHVKFKRLVRAAIANQTITVKRKDSDGVEYVDDTATKETNAAISDMRTKFGEWLWSDPTRRVQLEAEYNEVRNAYATPRFDGSFLGFQGMALSLGRGPFNLRQHQANAIWRALVTRKSLNAHEVGTGKTFTMGGIAVESRRYGIAKKPLILAHNANSKSVAHEIQQMYPAARVLYVDNLSKENVKTRMMQIANDDWDAVVVPHSLIGRIGFKEETLMGMAKEEIDDLKLAAQEAAAEDNVTITKEMWEDEEELAKLRSATAKQLVKARLKIITTIQKLAQQASREDSVAFEDLGIDMVMVDEAHEFKKPPIATKMKMKGLQTATSDRSIALMFMTKYIRAMNGGANVHLFTGTPITNTMTEVFHMMRYMMQEEMKDAALADWDGWFGSFAREVTDVELNPAGEYEAVTRLQSFINVPELRRMIGQYMDVVFAEDMPEMQLRLVNGKRLTDKDLTDEQRRAILQGRTENALDRPYKRVVNENSDMTPEQLRVFEKVQGYARSWRNMSKKARKEAMLSGAPESPIIHEGIAARASFDVRLVDAIRNAGLEGTPAMEPHPNSKPARVVKNLLEIYRSHPEANQVVFMEQGMAKSVTRREGPVGNKRNVNYPAFSTVHDMIERLVQAGVPREQIALVDGSTSKDKRKEVADAMNSGKIRIVFGSTDSLGVGVNMQRNLRAMHHMDAPWMPGELEQRNGRGHRQGNQWNTVMEFRYLTDRLDGRRWQVLAIKQKFITDFMKSKGDVRVIEGDAADDSGGDILATFSEAAGDPRLLLREKYKKKLEHLQSRERIHGNAVADAKRAVRDETANMEDAERRLDALRQAGARDAIDALVKSTMGDGFNAVIGGEAFNERAPALIALRKWIIENVRKESPEQKVGTFGGHDVFVHWLYKWADEPSLVLKFPGDVQVTASPSWQSLETQLRNKRDTVEATWEEAINTAREKIAHARKVAQEPFHLKAQLDDATKRLADLEEDIARNPVAPPYWLRSGAPADTDVVFNDKTFTVTGHRWSDAGWFVVARDDRGEIVIPYMEARDTQGMPLYEEREFEKPTVQQGTAAQGVPAKPPATPKPADDLDFRIDAADLPADTAAAYAAAPSEADQRAVKRLQLRMARYIPGVRLDAVAAAGGREAGQPLQGADRSRVAAAELLRALTGRRAVFFTAGRANFVNGVHSSTEPDVLFLRADSSRPHMAVLGHEFLHGLRADRPDLYEALRDRIRMVAPGRAKHGADLQAKRQRVGMALLDNDKLEEEFIADVMGDSWMDAQFWRDLAGKEPAGPLRRAFEAALRFINDVLAKLGDLNPFGTDVYLDDVRAARAAMAKALRDYVEVESVGAPEIGVDSFSMAPRQSQTVTPEFKRWFGDSKVVDAQGKPLVVYHGTRGDFTAFDGGRVKARFPNSEGFYFASSPRQASVYADSINNAAENFDPASRFIKPVAEGANVMPAYVSLQNPKIINVSEWGTLESAVDGDGGARVRAAKAAGHDGVIVERNAGDEYDGKLVIAFRPEQIKSAIGNRGTFDPNEADIRLSRALTRRDLLLGAAAAAATGGAQGKTTLGKAQPIPEAALRAALPADVQKILIGNGVGTTNLEGAKATKDALLRIAENGPQELRALARQTAALLPDGRLMLTVVGGRWNAHGAVSWGGPEGPHLRLMNGQGMEGLTYGTFIHEAMHAAVLARYINLNTGVVRDNDAKLGGTPKAAGAIEQFRKVWDEFRISTRGAREADANLQMALDEARGDPDEFFVRALTDPLLQRYMAGREYEGKTLWDRFKDWVKSTLFGFSKDGVTPSWLDAATTAAQDLLQAMPADAADYGRLGKYLTLKRDNAKRDGKLSRDAGDGEEVSFSLAVDALQSNDTARKLSERVMDVLRSDSTVGLLGRTVGTPYHLAHAKNADGSLRNPDLRRVYDEAQDYLNDINTFANDPAELAPGVVPMLNKWSDARNPLRLAGEKRARLARALFEGTLGWTRDDQGNPVESDDARGAGIEWTATELKQRYGFDDADVKLYQQTRAAIARSLDFMAAAEVARQMGGRDLPEGLRAMVSRGDTGRFRGLVTNFLTQQVDGAKFALSMLKTEHREQMAGITGPDADAKRAALKAKQAIALEVAQERLDKWQGLQRGVAKVYDRVTDLKDRGYMPLMRFGPHTVTVRDLDTKEVVFFGMYETQAEANVEARRLRESAAPHETVTRGEMSQEQWRLFKGMSPETIELFGQVAGVERTPVFEEYIRRTKANHSALKRLIQRKGTPGFSEDVQRVLAAFLTSNARAAAANLHAGAMEEATLAIDQERGLVKDYATRLTQYVQNPTDEAQGIRGLMFIQFIGGSVASALVNMTQPFTMTLPYLSQHGGPGAAARLLTAGMRKALTKIDPQSPLGVAMQRAEKDGIVSPQALHELQGQAVNRFGRIESGLRSLGVSTRAAEAIDSNLRRVLFAWGGFFSLAEQFNRRATFIAAYQLAQERQMADPFEFASEAVSATQGVYNRGNRPQWARGPVGATVMTFKQFSISYLEFLSRLPRREKAIALGVLTLAAGLEGLPFADDLDDLIDTIMQRLFGKAFSAKRAKVEALTAMGMSRDSAEWVLRGASALPGFPVDLAGRMSLGNMIPGTGILRTDGAKDKSAEVLEALGPAGGVVRDALRGEFSPVAVRNAAKGAEMYLTGQYRDEAGRRVADVDAADAAAKSLGFQPREIARESRDSRMTQSVVSQTRAAESEIVRLWAQGIADNEPDKVAEARAQLESWNQRNPEARIAINRMQIARQVRDMRATREERLIRATPKELRGRVAQELQQ